MSIRRGRSVTALLTTAVMLTGCSAIDWERSGQLLLGSLCEAASHCSYDGDGDPYTRW